MKYALDTSVLVRILSNRPQPLAGDVIRLVAARIGGGGTMAVSKSGPVRGL
jgi:predicted nucleic acid-binding protein